LTVEDAKAEAIRAVAPFTLDFVGVDWYTVYSIQQRLAACFQDRERILIAGDAAHTRSPGAAQGMNTGVGDAVNIGWKLVGTLKGWYKPEEIETYTVEWRGFVALVLDHEKNTTALISGQFPASMAGQGKQPNVLLQTYLDETAGFSARLCINYA
jgi:phenol 2-monooxygenase